MNTYTEILQDQFTDYAGKVHKFIIVALCESMKGEEAPKVVKVEGIEVDNLGLIVKGVRLGVAICNPTDKYEEKAGVYRAIARAEEADYSLLAPSRAKIGPKVVKSLLEQEADYVKKHPEDFIPGWEEMKERYLKRKRMEEIAKGFDAVERIVVEKLEENPKFLDNVNEYLEWMKNQRKGKCQKQKG